MSSIATIILPERRLLSRCVSTTLVGDVPEADSVVVDDVLNEVLIQVSLEVGEPPVHLKFGSTLQLLEQPSPDTILPSSHYEVGKRRPSPQIS